LKSIHIFSGGVYLKMSEPISLTGSAGGSAKDQAPLPPASPKNGSGKERFQVFSGVRPQGKS